MARRPRLALDRIIDMTTDDLRAEWGLRCDGPCPNIAIDLLRMGLAYHVQVQRHGGVSRATRAFLRRPGEVEGGLVSKPAAAPRKLTPGTRLIRDWHGVGHTVTVLERGFEYQEKSWKSLSAIAREITGTHWNGPRFFGLGGHSK